MQRKNFTHIQIETRFAGDYFVVKGFLAESV